MEAAFERVETASEVSWRSHVRRQKCFEFHWHFHPEHELTLITAGTGTRYVGDSIEQYGPADLVLTGPDLPHTLCAWGQLVRPMSYPWLRSRRAQ